MWEGKADGELLEVYRQYKKKFKTPPDFYEEILYEAMTYEEFVGYIKTCLETGKEIPDVVE